MEWCPDFLWEGTRHRLGLLQAISSSEIKQPFLPLSGSQSLQINGAAALLLQADTGQDKWHCSEISVSCERVASQEPTLQIYEQRTKPITSAKRRG